MAEDPVMELRELVEGLSEWLRYQRRLGWRGLPPEPAAAPGGEEQPAAAAENPHPGRDSTGNGALPAVQAPLADPRIWSLERARRRPG